MNGAKMSKNFFFQMIEKRLEKLTKEVETVKANKELSFEQRIARENMLFGRLMELNAMNSLAIDVDYWKYTKLNEKIKAVRDSI